MNAEAVRNNLRRPWADMREERDKLQAAGFSEHAAQLDAAMALLRGVADALAMAPETAAVLEAFPGSTLTDTVAR